MDSMHFISLARNPVLTYKRSCNINNGIQPSSLVVLITNKKVNIVTVRFPAGQIRITEEPNNSKTGLVLSDCSCVTTLLSLEQNLETEI